MLCRPLLLLLMVASLCPLSSGVAQDDFSYDEDAKWVDFGVGSWKLVRVYKDTLNGRGVVESTSTEETKSTLFDVNDDGYTVMVEVTVEVAGKRFAADPKYLKKHWNGKNVNKLVVVKEVEEENVEITGRRYPTRVRNILIHGKESKRKSKVYYSSDVAPYVLRMETTATFAANEKKNFDSLVEVIAVEGLTLRVRRAGSGRAG